MGCLQAVVRDIEERVLLRLIELAGLISKSRSLGVVPTPRDDKTRSLVDMSAGGELGRGARAR